MSMYITFTWQRPALSSRADGCVKEGPPCGSADARDLGIGEDYDKRQPGCGSRFWRVQGTAPPGCLCRLDKAHTRVPPLARLRSAPACGFEAHEREGQDGRRGPAPVPPAFSDTGEPAPHQPAPALAARRSCQGASRCRSPLIPRPHPRGSAFKVCGCASAPPHGCPAMACCRHPAGAGRRRAQGRRQPSGWCVDGIVVTCSDPARRCRAAPAGALGEAVFAEW